MPKTQQKKFTFDNLSTDTNDTNTTTSSATNTTTNTKCIGWDIGIKNLAYCIIEKIEVASSNKQSSTITPQNVIKIGTSAYKIHKWADISLVSQIDSNLQNTGEINFINTVLKCSAVKNSKINVGDILCGKNAIYCDEELNTDGTYKGYCKLHFAKTGKTNMPTVSVKKCCFADCKSKPMSVLKKHIYMGYCKKHVNEIIKTSVSTEGGYGGGCEKTLDDFFKINKAKSTLKIDINNLGISLFQELNKIKNDVLEPQIVLLENQPVLKNPTMKSMQMFLYSYFLMRQMETGTQYSKTIQCYTASKKLDIIELFPENEKKRIMSLLESVTNNYQKNKKQSIMMVEYLLKNDDTKELREFFNKNTKQDDLADALLMSIHYYEKKNIANIANIAKNKKIKKK